MANEEKKPFGSIKTLSEDDLKKVTGGGGYILKNGVWVPVDSLHRKK